MMHVGQRRASVTLILLRRRHPVIPGLLLGEQELRESDKAHGRDRSNGERLLDRASMQQYFHPRKNLEGTVIVMEAGWKTMRSMSLQEARRLRLPSEEDRLLDRVGQDLGGRPGTVYNRLLAPVQWHPQTARGKDRGEIEGEHSG
jgi:hypothetical protein